MHLEGMIMVVTTGLFIMDMGDCGTSVYSHTDYNCSVEEVKQSACLNDGTCFIIKLESREPSCHCPIEYTGKRCQELNFDVLFGSTQIAILVCVVVLLLLFAAVTVFICYRRRKKLPLVPFRLRKQTTTKDEEEVDVEGRTMLSDHEETEIEMKSNHGHN